MHTVAVVMTREGRLHVSPSGTPISGDTTDEPLVAMASTEATAEVAAKDPSPIAPEVKELVCGGGAFIVLFVVMRVYLFPRVRKGMDARYNKIRGSHESATALRSSARADVTTYEGQLAGVRSEAKTVIDAARQTLEAERTAAVAKVNASIAVDRASAMSANEAARVAASGDVRDAVAAVSTHAAELASGHRPDASKVQGIVDSLISGGAR